MCIKYNYLNVYKIKNFLSENSLVMLNSFIENEGHMNYTKIMWPLHKVYNLNFTLRSLQKMKATSRVLYVKCQ